MGASFADALNCWGFFFFGIPRSFHIISPPLSPSPHYYITHQPPQTTLQNAEIQTKSRYPFQFFASQLVFLSLLLLLLLHFSFFFGAFGGGCRGWLVVGLVGWVVGLHGGGLGCGLVAGWVDGC